MIFYLYDRRYHPGMQAAWADGIEATAPPHADPEEWRASARRLARHLGCDVRTGIHKRKDGYVVRAQANGGYPLGITDPYERDEWLRQRADADGG